MMTRIGLGWHNVVVDFHQGTLGNATGNCLGYCSIQRWAALPFMVPTVRISSSGFKPHRALTKPYINPNIKPLQTQPKLKRAKSLNHASFRLGIVKQTPINSVALEQQSLNFCKQK